MWDIASYGVQNYLNVRPTTSKHPGENTSVNLHDPGADNGFCQREA